MESTVAGQFQSKAHKVCPSSKNLKRMNLWVPERIYRSLEQEANAKGITITACAGLKLAGDVSSAGAVREAEVLNRQVADLRKQINQFENEKRSYSDLRMLYNQSLRAISALQAEKQELLKQRKRLEEANKSWQEKAAKDEEELHQIDKMFTRLSVLKAGGLDEQVESALRYVLLGQPLL